MKYIFSICCILFGASLAAQQTDYDLARTAYFSGQYEEALTYIQQCIELDTTNYRYFFLKGKTLENLYRFNEAIAAQQKALLLNPNAVEAKSAIGALYLQSGQPAISAQFYGQLATAEPEVSRWKMSWATALMAAGKYQNALEQLEIVEKTDTTNWLLYKNMGDCYYRIDSLLETQYYYYKSLILNPYNKILYGTLTRLLATKLSYDGATVVGSEAVTIDSTNVEAWKYLGVAYYKLNNYYEAQKSLEKALALGDTSLVICSHLGATYYFLHNDDEAEKYLLKAHKLNPEDMTVMYLLAVTYANIGKSIYGLELLDKLDKMIANIDTIGMKANIQRGYMLRKLSRYNGAVNAFITATNNFPKNPRYFYEVAVTYDRAFNKKKAFEWYTRCLEKIDPNWATRQWTEEELKKWEFVSNAMGRARLLREELFLEEENVKP